MKINAISTGSAGNLYEIVDKDGNSILIEAGESRATYVKHRIGKSAPEMCIISHGHSDHAHYRNEFKAVMPTYFMQPENVSANFKAMGFEMKHGDGKSMSFIIKSEVEQRTLFFCTDAEYGEYPELVAKLKILQTQIFMIECNYNDYLFHMATDEMRVQCSRHLSDNDVINFIRRVNPKNPIIITIHGSNRLSADTYTKKYLSGKLMNAKVDVAVGQKQGVKNIFSL